MYVLIFLYYFFHLGIPLAKPETLPLIKMETWYEGADMRLHSLPVFYQPYEQP